MEKSLEDWIKELLKEYERINVTPKILEGVQNIVNNRTMNRNQPVSDNAKYSNIINNTKGMYIGNSYANTPNMYTSPNIPQMYSKPEGMTEKVIKGVQDNINKAKERLKNKEDILLNRKVV